MVLFVFYDNFLKFCNLINKSPSAVAVEIGLEKSTVTRWKRGGNPTDATAKKIADYFGVTVDYLLTGEEMQKNKPVAISDELTQDEFEMLEIFRSATPEKKKAMMSLLKDRQ